LVTQTEAAKRLGVSQQSVSKLVRSGKLPTIDGRIPIELAGAVLRERLHPGRSKILKNMTPARPPEEHDERLRTTRGVAAQSPVDAVSYSDAKALREHFEGLKAKLEYERRCNDLVERQQVEAVAYRLGRLTRDTLLGLPQRIAVELAAVTDHAEAERLLVAAIRAALDDVARLSKDDLAKLLEAA
jgi:transcriptional regulator with XRE-family HTH domain